MRPTDLQYKLAREVIIMDCNTSNYLRQVIFEANLLRDKRVLPDLIKTAMEALFGINLNNINIYTNPLIAKAGARAFAYGDGIYFAPVEYQLESSDGWRVLGHEIAHIRQQKSGLLTRLLRNNLEIVHDDFLEAEADVFGDLAARMFETGKVPMNTINKQMENIQSCQAIQCLMTLTEFKNVSKASGFRDKIVPVDNALIKYHTLDTQKLENKDYVVILAQLRKLYAACDKYKKDRPNSVRNKGVDALMREICFEEVVLSSLAEYQTAANEIDKWEKLEETQNRYLKLAGNKEFSRLNFFTELDFLINKHITIMRQSGSDSKAILEDIETLKKLITLDQIPGIIKDVVNEITAPANIQQLSMCEFTPGLKYNVNRGKILKYTLKHNLNQGLGRRFRLGSLAHELTHLSNAETFGNTVLIFAIDPSASDKQIVNLAKIRRSHLLGLQALLAFTPSTEISYTLKNEIQTKLEYPLSGKLGIYLSNFQKQMENTTEGIAYRTRISDLYTKGLVDCELIEYDSVINQIMLWCHLYKVKLDNKFYKQIQTCAQLAYNYRADFRLKKRRIVSVSPVNKTIIQGTHDRRKSF